MTDIEKLNTAKILINEVYQKYGDLFRDNYAICNPIACADAHIIEAVDALKTVREAI
jgi:hypothetical protein